jgi:hypothetical protein
MTWLAMRGRDATWTAYEMPSDADWSHELRLAVSALSLSDAGGHGGLVDSDA